MSENHSPLLDMTRKSPPSLTITHDEGLAGLFNHIALKSNCLFFFNDTATTEIYTLSLHDALPISCEQQCHFFTVVITRESQSKTGMSVRMRSEEHTSELQSQSNLVCRLLLEK